MLVGTWHHKPGINSVLCVWLRERSQNFNNKLRRKNDLNIRVCCRGKWPAAHCHMHARIFPVYISCWLRFTMKLLHWSRRVVRSWHRGIVLYCHTSTTLCRSRIAEFIFRNFGWCIMWNIENCLKKYDFGFRKKKANNNHEFVEGWDMPKRT